MASKFGQISIIVILASLTLGSMSVMGLLQSTERMGTSGIIVRPDEESMIIPPTTYLSQPPPPEPVIEIDVFRDLACTQAMSNVEWGEIDTGSSSDVKVYVQNSGDTSVIISLITDNWSSTTAKNNLDLTWNFNGIAIQPGQVREVTLTLSVKPECPELSSFGFDIIIVGA